MHVQIFGIHSWHVGTVNSTKTASIDYKSHPAKLVRCNTKPSFVRSSHDMIWEPRKPWRLTWSVECPGGQLKPWPATYSGLSPHWLDYNILCSTHHGSWTKFGNLTNGPAKPWGCPTRCTVFLNWTNFGLENMFYFLLLRCQLMRTVEFVHKDSPQSKDIQFFAADVDCCEPRRSFLCGDAAKPSARMGKSGWRRGSVESSDSGSYIEKDNQLSLIHQQTFFWRAYLSLQFSSIFLEHYSYM